MESGVPSVPDVSFVDPMQRRRLSSLARMTLCVANQCCAEVADAGFVFASRHGELARTTTMLEDIADHEPLSPTVFGMSVLNASTGLFSILKQNTAPASAVSAGCSSFAYGLLEAARQWLDAPGKPVLYVYADEPAPAVYGAKEVPGATPHALGMLLGRGGETSVRCCLSASSADASEEGPSRAFRRALEQGEALWSGEGKTWHWTSKRQ